MKPKPSDFIIVEYIDRFTIKRKIQQPIGHLWWKQSETLWYPCSKGGTPIDYQTLLQIERYSTLKSARRAIAQFCKGPIIHKPR